jgi:hypothetical protein
MQTLIECILPSMRDWIEWEYGVLMPPTEWESMAPLLTPNAVSMVPPGFTLPGGETCGGDPEHPLTSESSLLYCPIDGSVYLGMDALWERFQRFGDTAVLRRP